MKKRVLALLLCAVSLLLLCIAVLGAGGDEGDPVVSQSYLEVWKEQLLQEIRAEASQSAAGTSGLLLGRLGERTAAMRLEHEKSYTGVRSGLGRVLLKEGDGILFKQGCRFLVLSGSLTAEGTLANVTQGTAVDPSRTPILPTGQAYMQKSVSGKRLTVTSATAELWITGNYTLAVSDAVDYGSLADALFEMGMFRGMGDGYGLEGATTRVQGLVMFLRLMGMEQEALACRDNIPFTDVPQGHWAYGYVAYAARLGLTNGTSATTFEPDAPITAKHYLTFLLRALHYEEGTAFTYLTSETDAVKLELFTEPEILSVREGSLRRFQMVYLSYYGLYARDAASKTTLLERLLREGTVTEDAIYRGIASVKSLRMKSE